MTEVVVWHNARCSKSRGACALLDEQILIERPIVIRGDHAVIARPAERLLDLLA